jgi:hypothetical protein
MRTHVSKSENSKKRFLKKPKIEEEETSEDASAALTVSAFFIASRWSVSGPKPSSAPDSTYIHCAVSGHLHSSTLLWLQKTAEIIKPSSTPDSTYIYCAVLGHIHSST